jgi:hypothetical protein
MHYTKSDGTLGTCVKDVDLTEAEKAKRDGRFEWCSSEGVAKAMILKQYVQVLFFSFFIASLFLFILLFSLVFEFIYC